MVSAVKMYSDYLDGTVNGTPVAASAHSCDGICHNATSLVCSKHTGSIFANRDVGKMYWYPLTAINFNFDGGALKTVRIGLQSAGRLDSIAYFHESSAMHGYLHSTAMT